MSLSAIFKSYRLGGLTVLAMSSVLVLVAAWATTTEATASGQQTVLPMQYPAVRDTEVACFNKGSRTYVGETEPARCEVAGDVEFAGVLEGGATENASNDSLARFPIKGEFESIEWDGDWGTFKSYGLSAINTRNGSEIRLILNRRIRCAGGGTWYSRATVFNLDSGYDAVLRLPVCNGPI